MMQNEVQRTYILDAQNKSEQLKAKASRVHKEALATLHQAVTTIEYLAMTTSAIMTTVLFWTIVDMLSRTLIRISDTMSTGIQQGPARSEAPTPHLQVKVIVGRTQGSLHTVLHRIR